MRAAIAHFLMLVFAVFIAGLGWFMAHNPTRTDVESCQGGSRRELGFVKNTIPASWLAAGINLR